jgi:outer membrane protein
VGERITLDVLDQERELLEAQLALIGAQRAVYLATFELLAAMGVLKPELAG